MDQIVLVGGGGHCISCIDVIRSTGKFEIVGIIDMPEKKGSFIKDIPVIGTDDDIPSISHTIKNFLITVGQIKSAAIRMKLHEILKECNATLPVIISSRAYVSSSSFIDEGTIIMHNAIINADSCIGKSCIINTGSLIEHETKIEDFCHISTCSVLNGQVIVGQGSFIGSNSVISNNIILPAGIIVAAGAAILKCPSESGVYIGNPAKKSLR